MDQKSCLKLLEEAFSKVRTLASKHPLGTFCYSKIDGAKFYVSGYGINHDTTVYLELLSVGGNNVSLDGFYVQKEKPFNEDFDDGEEWKKC